MTLKERALDITQKLQAAHASVGENAELDALHDTLREGLEEQAVQLGFTDDDLADIENAGVAARGGAPKPVRSRS